MSPRAASVPVRASAGDVERLVLARKADILASRPARPESCVRLAGADLTSDKSEHDIYDTDLELANLVAHAHWCQSAEGRSRERRRYGDSG